MDEEEFEEIEEKQAIWEWQNPFGWASYDVETSKFLKSLFLTSQPILLRLHIKKSPHPLSTWCTAFLEMVVVIPLISHL